MSFARGITLIGTLLTPPLVQWNETVNLLSRLYEASHPLNTAELDTNSINRDEEHQPLSSGDITLGSGYPFPQNLKSQRMFDNIRMIIMTAADPPALRNHQTRLHVQNLWNRTLFQSPNIIQSATRNETVMIPGGETMPTFEDFSTLDDMLNFMDDFQSFQTSGSTQFPPVNHSVGDRLHISPYP